MDNRAVSREVTENDFPINYNVYNDFAVLYLDILS